MVNDDPMSIFEEKKQSVLQMGGPEKVAKKQDPDFLSSYN